MSSSRTDTSLHRVQILSVSRRSSLRRTEASMDWLTANRDPSPRGRVPTTRQSAGALRNCPRNLDLIGSTPVVGRRLKSTFGLQAAQRCMES